MNIVFYISAHGLGHASRDIQVINEIARQQPNAHIVIRSAVPKWFLDASVRTSVTLQPCESDTGIVQIDSLTLDEAQTARRAAAFYGDFDARVRSEAAILQQLNASVVVGDIPPLAFAAAAGAGVRSVALGNFTWDWIYEDYPQFGRLAPGVIDRIRSANVLASRALRLPFAGGFEAMRSVRDIPLIARRSRLGRAQARNALGLGAGETVAVASFGGYGLALDYDEIAHRNGLTVLVTGHERTIGAVGAELPPPLVGSSGELRRDHAVAQRAKAGASAPRGRLLRTTSRELAERRLSYEDLVAASDIVVTKPGYGIVSECIANNAALLYTSRGRFREYDVLVAEMPAFVRCREISQADLKAGRWRDAAMALLEQPPPPERRIPTNGAEVAAREILDFAYTG